MTVRNGTEFGVWVVLSSAAANGAKQHIDFVVRAARAIAERQADLNLGFATPSLELGLIHALWLPRRRHLNIDQVQALAAQP